MIFIFRLICIAVLSYLSAMVMPWWSAMLSSALIAFLLPGNNLNAFLSGFLGVGLIWLLMAWKIDTETGSILSEKMVTLFPIDDKNILIIITGTIGGLAGALGAFTGNSFRQTLAKRKEKSFYR